VEGDTAVSARDALMGALWDNYTAAEKNAFIDAYAHELAERVRDQRHDGHDQIKCVPCFIYGHAADLIDPTKDTQQ